MTACLSAMSAAVFAQHRSDTIAERTHQLQDVTVSMKRLGSSLTASKPIQLMQRDELEALGLVSLADAVKRFAGTNVRDYGGIGGMKTVSIRNLGAHHTAVSYDGITVSNTQAGQIDIGRFSLDNVQTVGLAVGENADMMQSARHYASAGVLFIETERPHFSEGANHSLQLRVRGGSFGLISPSLRYWQKLGSRTVLTLDGTYMRADGTYPFLLKNGYETTHEKRYNSDIYSWQGEANLLHTFRDSSQLNVKSQWYYSQRGLPGVVVLYNNHADDRMWDEDFFAQALYKKVWNAHWQLQTRLKYVHTWNRYEATNAAYENGMQIDVDRQNEYYASATLGWSPLEQLKMSLATDVMFNDLRNNIYINTNREVPNPKRFTSLTALALRYNSPFRLTVDATLVGTFVTESVETGTTPPDRKHLSPTLSLNYRLLENEALYLRALWKNTFRVPTFNDLYYRRLGNTQLRPEKAHEWNVGITWGGQPVEWVKYLSITLDGYWNRVTDKIVAFPAAYVWRMANYGKARIVGLDATLAAEIPVSRQVSLLLNAAYTQQKATDRDPSSATYKAQLPYTPQSNGNFSLTGRTPWVIVGYSVAYCGSRYSMAQNKPEYKMDAYWEHTLTLSREWQLRRAAIKLSASVVNLTNAHYEVIQYYPMPGRAFNATGSITF